MKRIFFLLITLFVITQSYSQNRNKGYRGFADLGAHFNIGDTDAKGTSYNVSTSHGYQFNPHIFLGGGAGFDYYSDAEEVFIPLFANIRLNLLDSKVSPYFDLKAGYSVGQSCGIYANPSLGVGIFISPKYVLNLSVSCVAQESERSVDHPIDNSIFRRIMLGAGFKIGLEF
ncbi:hypothetical protein M2132_002338 [Dysgonomonas sp. PH5-45]|uniref:outer membrane beta-barrel protein n=1 Tax=unclassified Dysgonomonas TaxID=2630389 RepID=UPI0024730A9C|nr:MULTISPECIES: outer membrane beta-barrel protein [unclassified Dysgonomonas]MDH6355987.1 hypothetical protein [Dysgonomonas sp. PH5-45]MDH6388882.1 hypothetical protein [Dysgonomonas sp. PH5-37]